MKAGNAMIRMSEARAEPWHSTDYHGAGANPVHYRK